MSSNIETDPFEGITYEKKKDTTGIQGQEFEIKLNMFILLKLLPWSYADVIRRRFKVGTNMNVAGLFDDVAVQIVTTLPQNGQTKMFFIQTKHREKDTKKLVFDKLFPIVPPNGATAKPKGLIEYFESYKSTLKNFINIKQMEKSEFIFYTNAPLNAHKCWKIIDKQELQEKFSIIPQKENSMAVRIDVESSIIQQRSTDYYPQSGDKTEFLAFLKQITIFTQQPSEHELDEIILNELVRFNNNQPVNNVKPMFYKAFCNVKDWWKSIDNFEPAFLTPNCNFFVADGVEDMLTQFLAKCGVSSYTKLMYDEHETMVELFKMPIQDLIKRNLDFYEDTLPALEATESVETHILQMIKEAHQNCEKFIVADLQLCVLECRKKMKNLYDISDHHKFCLEQILEQLDEDLRKLRDGITYLTQKVFEDCIQEVISFAQYTSTEFRNYILNIYLMENTHNNA